VITLAQLCERHVYSSIDFLSVDVEGHEEAALAGGDWSRWRPRVVVVDGTEPDTRVASHPAWEHLLVEAGYLAAGFDGVNRYYVRSEDEQLVAAFATPVNVFDDFVPYEHWKALGDLRSRAESAERHLAAARAANETLLAESATFREQLESLQHDYVELRRAAERLRADHEATRAALGDFEGRYDRVVADISAALSQSAAIDQLVRARGRNAASPATRLAALPSELRRILTTRSGRRRR
jgi:hypothetical protein